jgi:hypothetical protein
MSHYEAPIRKPLVIGDKSYHDVTVDVARPVEGRANKLWWTVFSIALAAIVLAFSVKGVLLVYSLDNFVHTPFNNQESHTAQLNGIIHSLKNSSFISTFNPSP